MLRSPQYSILYGASTSACFAQPMLLYRAGKTLFLTDLVADKILMIVPMEENQQFLCNMGDLYKAMGIQ